MPLPSLGTLCSHNGQCLDDGQCLNDGQCHWQPHSLRQAMLTTCHPEETELRQWAVEADWLEYFHQEHFAISGI